MLFSWLMILVLFSLAETSQAAGASLYLSPLSGTFFTDSTFTVSIFLNSGGESVNAVKAELIFDPKKLQIVSPSAGQSFISVWVARPSYSNLKGTAAFQGGLPSPGLKTSAGLVSTISFRAIAPGEAMVSLDSSSQVFLNDGNGTNVLNSLGRAVYQIKTPPPEGPEVFSLTHPEQHKWYNNNQASLNWQKEEGVTDFSYTLDQDSYGLPDNLGEGEHSSIDYIDLADGIWFFHIKAKKAGLWGGVTHYRLQIDSSPPADFPLSFEPSFNLPNTVFEEPVVFFLTTDAFSGLDHYEIQTIDLESEPAQGEGSFFVDASSPYHLLYLTEGNYLVVVRAYDQAKNWRDVSVEIEVVPKARLFYFIKSGFHFWRFSLSWPVLLLLLLLLLLCFGAVGFYWLRKRRFSLKQRQKRLAKLKEELALQQEILKDKLNKP